jgi:hypothetical protein
MGNTSTYIPNQKVASLKKTKEWFITNIDAGEALLLNNNSNSINFHREQKINLDIYEGIINESDIDASFNPMGFSGNFPASTQNYAITAPKVDLLIGEEWKRRFDWKLITVSEDAISEIETSKLEKLMELTVNSIKEKQQDPNKIQQSIQRLDKYYRYEYQDIKQDIGTKILKYLWHKENLQRQYNDGFKDLLIQKAIIYRVDIVAGEVKSTKCNPLNVFISNPGDSLNIEDSDRIAEVTYEPIGQVIDEFYEYLSSKDITALEDLNVGTSHSGSGVLKHTSMTPTMTIDALPPAESDDLIDMDNVGNYSVYGDYTDDNGNIRVFRYRWAGFKKIYKRTFFDQQTGEQLEDIKSEHYKPNKELGETVKAMWIKEWHEGVKIGEDIYPYGRIREVQYRNRNNLSVCSPGYVGTIIPVCLMDMMKQYQYLYNIFMKRAEYAFARYKAPIMEIDISKKPHDWDMDKWMYYSEVVGYMFVNPFNESQEGASKGTLAGNFNTTGKVLHAEMGNYIQQLINMLQFIEIKLGEVAGVTKEREGQSSPHDTATAVQQKVTQSSHITEKWFATLDDVKLRHLTTLLETAKYAYKDNKNKIIHYILDDLASEYLKFDGESLNESEFGLFASNSKEDTQIFEDLKKLSHALIQNDQMNIRTLLDIYTSDSISAIRRKIERSEIEKEDKQQEQQQIQAEAEQSVRQADTELKMFEINSKNTIEKEKMQNAIELKILDIEGTRDLRDTEINDDDVNDNGIKDELDQQKIKLMEMKAKMDNSIKKDQLVETKRHNKQTEQISRIKPKVTKK